MKKALIAIVLVAVIAAGGYAFWKYKTTEAVTPDILKATLENSSELTTQKLIYEGVVPYEEGKIPILTKDSFLLVYKATVRAGFDVSDTEVKVNDSTVEVTLPAMEVQEITIDPNEIRTYNTSITLVKPDEKESLTEALKLAEADAEEKAASSGLLEAAAENAESVVKGLLKDAVGEKEIVIKHK